VGAGTGAAALSKIAAVYCSSNGLKKEKQGRKFAITSTQKSLLHDRGASGSLDTSNTSARLCLQHDS
jgi:hypothetical protein